MTSDLPEKFRGRAGYTRMLHSIPIRISVSGTRGKSGLTKMCEAEFRARGMSTMGKITGTDPVVIRNGETHPIVRPRRQGALFDENLREVSRWYGDGIDALIMENQAISPYTMRVFNARFCQPHYLLINNIRSDHRETLGEHLEIHAYAYGRSALPGSAVISGERNARLSSLLRRATESMGARFVDAAPPPGIYPPGYESVTVMSALLGLSTGAPLSDRRLETERLRLHRHFQWKPSAHDGIVWFHGAEINDIESTDTILRYLNHHDPRPVSYVAYFRPDRRDRTTSFIEYFTKVLEAGECERIYMAGPGTKFVAKSLAAWRDRLRTYEDDEPGRLLADATAECRGEAIMTVANAVPPFPRRVAEGLAAPTAPLTAQERVRRFFGRSAA